MWMYSTENANIGKGPGYLLGYYIFIKTTPMLLLALGYMAERKRYLICTMILVALVLSGTRANAALGVLVFGLSLILAEKNNTKKALIIIVVIILGFYIFIGQEMFLKYMTYSASKIGSDLVRAGTLESILDSWKKSPFSLFFGQGYTSTFYNMGRMEWNSDVELAYWNLLRRVGLGCFILMMIGYLYPIRWMIKTKKNIVLAFAYLMYLVGAYINPLLYTSTGVTVLLFMYCVAFIEYDEKLESSSVEV